MRAEASRAPGASEPKVPLEGHRTAGHRREVGILSRQVERPQIKRRNGLSSLSRRSYGRSTSLRATATFATLTPRRARPRSAKARRSVSAPARTFPRQSTQSAAPHNESNAAGGRRRKGLFKSRGPVADGDHRGSHASPLQMLATRRPRTRLPVAVRDGDELFSSV